MQDYFASEEPQVVDWLSTTQPSFSHRMFEEYKRSIDRPKNTEDAKLLERIIGADRLDQIYERYSRAKLYLQLARLPAELYTYEMADMTNVRKLPVALGEEQKVLMAAERKLDMQWDSAVNYLVAGCRDMEWMEMMVRNQAPARGSKDYAPFMKRLEYLQTDPMRDASPDIADTPFSYAYNKMWEMRITLVNAHNDIRKRLTTPQGLRNSDETMLEKCKSYVSGGLYSKISNINWMLSELDGLQMHYVDLAQMVAEQAPKYDPMVEQVKTFARRARYGERDQLRRNEGIDEAKAEAIIAASDGKVVPLRQWREQLAAEKPGKGPQRS